MATLLAPYVADRAAAEAQEDVTRLVLTLLKRGSHSCELQVSLAAFQLKLIRD